MPAALVVDRRILLLCVSVSGIVNDVTSKSHTEYLNATDNIIVLD